MSISLKIYSKNTKKPQTNLAYVYETDGSGIESGNFLAVLSLTGSGLGTAGGSSTFRGRGSAGFSADCGFFFLTLGVAGLKTKTE